MKQSYITSALFKCTFSKVHHMNPQKLVSNRLICEVVLVRRLPYESACMFLRELVNSLTETTPIDVHRHHSTNVYKGSPVEIQVGHCCLTAHKGT